MHAPSPRLQNHWSAVAPWRMQCPFPWSWRVLWLWYLRLIFNKASLAQLKRQQFSAIVWLRKKLKLQHHWSAVASRRLQRPFPRPERFHDTQIFGELSLKSLQLKFKFSVFWAKSFSWNDKTCTLRPSHRRSAVPT